MSTARNRLSIGLFLLTLVASAPLIAATHVVVIDRMAFQPLPAAQIDVGDTIEWRNDDVVPHTATSEAAGIDVQIDPGKTASTAVTQTGTFAFFCRYHPTMTIELEVK